MAMACLRLVTFLPLRPLLSLPCFIAFISASTFLPADGEYLRREDFFADEVFVAGFLDPVFFAGDFLAADFFPADVVAREAVFAEVFLTVIVRLLESLMKTA